MKAVKCVIWDLDHTLWEGTLLEGDDLRLRPGVEDILRTLDARGILMSIASRNEYAQAMERLRGFGIEHYFLYPQIGWQAKSASVALIREKLNIGMDTLLFIDDQPFEREEAQSVHAELTVLDAADYMLLLSMPRLRPDVITGDSARRRQMYVEDQRRQQDEQAYEGPMGDFLSGLGMVFTVSRACEADLLRAEELTVRTNQLNSTGVMYGYDELQALLDSPRHRLWICELTDKYGSYGKIGLALVEVADESWTIRLLLMSCRTVSRGAGTVLLSFIMKQARSAGARLRADFIRTSSNRQMLLTYQFAGFRELGRDGDRLTFENKLETIQEYPSYIRVVEEKPLCEEERV